MCADIIREALGKLTKDEVFQIVQIGYDKQNFGNAFATLKSSENVNLRFIKDKGAKWCEIGQGAQWYFAEDVFAALGVAFMDDAEEFADYLEKAADMLQTMAPRIFEAFSLENMEATKAAIKAAASKRVEELLEENL